MLFAALLGVVTAESSASSVCGSLRGTIITRQVGCVGSLNMVKCKLSVVLLQAEGYDKGLEQRVTNLEATVSQLQK